MEISDERISDAMKVADENTKKVLVALFGNDVQQKDNRPITERIKTFDDAIKELGESHTLVRTYNSAMGIIQSSSEDMFAYLKLRIICAALNEGWEPKFIKDEWRHYPGFYLYTQEELDDMYDYEKKERRIIGTGDYQTEYAGFGLSGSSLSFTDTSVRIGSRLCLRTSDLAVYCGKQFIKLWADCILFRK